MNDFCEASSLGYCSTDIIRQAVAYEIYFPFSSMTIPADSSARRILASAVAPPATPPMIICFINDVGESSPDLDFAYFFDQPDHLIRIAMDFSDTLLAPGRQPKKHLAPVVAAYRALDQSFFLGRQDDLGAIG